MVKEKIVYIISHPIQYYAALFKHLNNCQLFDFEVWYLSKHGLQPDFDREFKTRFQWDIDLLDGYSYRFIKNNSVFPGIYSFFGLANFGVIYELRTLPNNSIVIVPGWNYFTYILSIVCGYMMRHKICLRCETPIIHEMNRKWTNLLRRNFLRTLFKFIRIFLYIGKANKKFYEFYGIKSERLVFTPYAVNNDYFQQQSLKLKNRKEDIKNSLNIPDDHQIILYSGKLIKKKNPLDLLFAFRSLPDDMKATLIFMGEGDQRKSMEKVVKEEQLSQVIFTGFINQSQVSELYSIADLFVMCSGQGETWGLSTNEAMNFGIPVIVSDETGNASDLVNGNGFIFRTNDIDDLRACLLTILNADTETKQAMSNQSIDIVNKYSFEEIALGLSSIG